MSAAATQMATDQTPNAAGTGGCDPPVPVHAPVNSGRETSVIQVFVSIADSLAAGHDLMDLYSNLTSDCARLLAVASAGLLLADPAGVLHVMAASSERARDLEVFQLQRKEGPCLDCHRTGAPVLVPDLATARARWPHFTAIALDAGFASVHAVPMRLHDTVLGSLNLFGTGPGVLNAADLDLAQAFAHVASVALIAGKAAADTSTLNTQLQTALDSRVVLEQAKGILGQLGDLDMGDAFTALRRYARDHNLRLSDLAAAVVSRGVLAGVVLAHARAKGVLATTTPREAGARPIGNPANLPPSAAGRSSGPTPVVAGGNRPRPPGRA